MTVDAATIKAAAAGRWKEILPVLGGIDRKLLNGKNDACPKCGGTDRFSLVDADAGAVLCRHCFAKQNGDGLAALQWLRGWTFPETCKAVADYLGLCNGKASGNDHAAGNGKPSSSPAGKGQSVLDRIAAAKHCPADSLRSYGAKEARGKLHLPMYTWQDGKPVLCSVFTMDAAGKGLNAKGKPAGMFLPGHGSKPGEVDAPAPGETWIVVEGGKDSPALHGLGYRVVGLPGCRIKAEWIEAYRGVHVIILMDADKAGQDGAAEIAKMLQGVAASVKIARLPVEVTNHSGKDVRDVLREQGAEAVRKCIADATPAGEDGLPIEPAEPPAFLTLIDSFDLDALNAHPHFIVKDVIVSGQPCVIGGRSKTLKTSIMLDLAISLGSGTPFLNRFPVPEPVAVAVWSGESGTATIQETARRIATSKGLELKTLPILWGFSLPKLSLTDHLDAMRELITRRELHVAIVDPLYLSLSAGAVGKPGDVYFMGSILEPLGAIGRDTGCTIILLHHFRKGAGQQQDDQTEPCNLEDLSQAGIVEWARQWVLLQRRQPYEGGGQHDLWMRTGGSAGHAGLWAVDVREGDLDPDTWGGRTWDVEVKAVQDAREEKQREREARRAAQAAEKESQHVERLREVLRRFPEGETKRQLRDVAKLNTAHFATAITTLIELGEVCECEIRKARGRYEGYRIMEESPNE